MSGPLPPNLPQRAAQGITGALHRIQARRSAALPPEIDGRIPLDEFPQPGATQFEIHDEIDSLLAPVRDKLDRVVGILSLVHQAQAQFVAERAPIDTIISLPTVPANASAGQGAVLRFDPKGRPYNVLWSDNAVQIFVKMPGLAGALVTLNVGWNETNFPEGTELQAIGQNPIFLLQRSSFENRSGAI